MSRGILQSRWLTVLAATAVLFLGASFLKKAPSFSQLQKEINNFDQKINQIKVRNSELKESASYYVGGAYFERQARLKLNYKKPDESVVFVYSAKKDEGKDVKAASEGASKEESIFIKISNFFSEIF